MRLRNTLAAVEGKLPDERVKAFLVRLVNAPVSESQDDADYMFRVYSEFLPHDGAVEGL